MNGLAGGWLKVDCETQTAGYGTYSAWGGFQNRQINCNITYLLLSGRIQVQLHHTGQTFTLQPGAFFLLSPNIPHTFALLQPDESIAPYHFRLRFQLEDGGDCALDDDYLHIPSAQFLRPDIDRLYDIVKSASPYREEQLQGIMILLFAQILRTKSLQSHRRLSARQQSRLNRFMRDHIHERPTAVDLANVVGLSPDYFARLFKQTYGVNARTQLVNERIQFAAMLLLETSKSITQIADDLGYADMYLFSRQFKQVVGCSPSNFRHKHH